MFHEEENRSALTALEAFMTAIEMREIPGVISAYEQSEDVYVFLEGPRWATHGYESVARGWSAYQNSTMGVLGHRWVEGPQLVGSESIVSIQGILDLDYTANGKSNVLRMRMTWVLRKNLDGKWGIVHEHASQPMPDPYGAGDWLDQTTNRTP
jgi:ketosteroid isomerase-like protein